MRSAAQQRDKSRWTIQFEGLAGLCGHLLKRYHAGCRILLLSTTTSEESTEVLHTTPERGHGLSGAAR